MEPMPNTRSASTRFGASAANSIGRSACLGICRAFARHPGGAVSQSGCGVSVSELTWEAAVVRDKDEIMPAVAAWDRKATAQGFRCVVCSTTIAYIDREEFFRTKMCGSGSTHETEFIARSDFARRCFIE